MSILEVHTYTGATANIVSLEADGGTRRERGATIAAAVRRMRASGLTVEKISTHYDEAYGFLARTTCRYRVTVTEVATYKEGDRAYFIPSPERAPFGTAISEGAVIVIKVVDHGAATQHSPRFTYVVEALDGSGTQGTDARELGALAAN